MNAKILYALAIHILVLTSFEQLNAQDVILNEDTRLYKKYFEMSAEELFGISIQLTTGSDQNWLRTPSAAYVLTHEEMMHSGHSHIAEQLRMVPGVMVSQTNSNTWAISTRSFQHFLADKQLMLQDGREIYSPTFGGVFWDTADLPVEILDSIEVIRGPGATLWGSNAVNGIINIRTLEAVDAQDNVLTVGGGTRDFGKVSFRQGGEIFGGYYYTGGKWMQNHGIRDLNDGLYHNGELKKGGIRMDLPGFGENGWTLRAEYFDHDHFTRFRGPFVVTSLTTMNFLPELEAPAHAHGGSIHADWSGSLDWGLDWKLQTYYSMSDRDWNSVLLDFGLDTYHVDFQVGKKLGRHDLLAGYRYRKHDICVESEGIPASVLGVIGGSAISVFDLAIGESIEEINSFFLQDTISLAENIHLLVGTKFEDNVTDDYWIPSGRIWWNVDSRSTLWASISKAHQLPGYSSRYANITVGYIPQPTNPLTYQPLSIQSDPNTLPAELEQMEIGWRQLLNEELSYDITAFFGKYDNLTLGGDHNFTGNFHNTDEAESFGGEIALNWQPSTSLHIRSSVSYSDTKIEGPGASTREYSQAKWRGHFRANYSPVDQLVYHLSLYASERAFAEVPGYIRTDIGTTWSPNKDWEISLHIQNLFDPFHPEDMAYFNGQFAQEIPRTAFLEVRRWF